MKPMSLCRVLCTANLLALSTLFVVESAMAEDHKGWRTVCEVPNMELAAVRSGIRTPPDASLAGAGQAWLRRGNDYAILTMPGCNVHKVAMPDAVSPVSVRFVSAGGYVLGSWDNKTRLRSWWVGNGSLRSMRGPPDSITSGEPILSTDSHWVAWIEAPAGNPRSRHVIIQSLDDQPQRIVDLPPSGWVLLDADMGRQELTLFEYNAIQRYAGLVVVGLNGVRRGPPLIAEGVEPQDSTILRVGSGWVAWDATRDGAFEPFRIAWSLPEGRGSQRTTAGRSITAVAVNPTGSYIAVSETNGSRIHFFKDVVYVLRTSDGKKVWQRTLPMFARSSLAFLGDGMFAYTEMMGSLPTVRVLQIAD
jgi:outer membrane protein assembly factor BamB